MGQLEETVKIRGLDEQIVLQWSRCGDCGLAMLQGKGSTEAMVCYRCGSANVHAMGD